MASQSPKPKPVRKTHAKPIVDQAVIHAKQASAIEHILPEAKNDPDLYQRVIDNLNDGEIGRAERWCDYRPAKSFYVWCSMTTDEDRPPLHTFLTLLAAHQCLRHNFNDKFTNIIKTRRLVQWAQQELQPKQAGSQARITVVTKKEENEDHSSSNLSRVVQGSQVNRQEALPSIEKRSQPPSEQSTSRLSLQGGSWLDDPFRSGSSMKRKSSPEPEHRESGRGFKTTKDYHEHRWAAVPTTDSATQTAEPVPEISDKILSAIKHAIGDAVDQKLAECLLAAMKEATRQDAENEAARQQSDEALLARVMRAAEPQLALTRQIPQTYVPPVHEQPQVYGVASLQYEDVRPVALNFPRGRILQTDVQGRRLGLFQ
ncbi:hypothetical protein B0J13DRAFT_650431 [Dactylonectria estremocensis]|uniref:Uncharacterized protein n=1 Tax=Dactylonectria estremocensis TaxID=1079267 RepID=A0A9P9FC20_9HYPO|nr:hypothetical protein B0J13DRAFT_650431 [Dactylonectria estremocensis]